jgi:hypothetical protein
MSDPKENLHPDHTRVLADHILGNAGYTEVPSQARPKAIVLAGQPGAGKGTVADNALADLKDQAVVIDPDELRRLHPDFNPLKERYPYTWGDHTHADASQWAKELRADAIHNPQRGTNRLQGGNKKIPAQLPCKAASTAA